MDGNDIGKCPVMHGASIHTTNEVRSNGDWWPNQLNLKILNQNTARTDPFGGKVDYAKSFETLDVAALKADMAACLGTRQGRTVLRMVVAAQVAVNNVLPRLTAGLTTAILTKRVVLCGR